VSEPHAVARSLEEIEPGLFHWHVKDERIGGYTSAAHALSTDDGTVLIDPLPLADDALAQLEPVEAIVLTAACHQRSSWRYRKRFGVPVWLPEGSRETDEEPSARYAVGTLLPGGLEPVHTPGPELPHYSLLERTRAVLFCSDLVGGGPDGLELVPPEFHDDPEETRRSVERLLALPFELFCLDHGLPVRDDPKALLRLALR
jgi:glyoxylase-like metal-dependent hydrolase (beta-lactamase superfamily II)